MKYSLEHVKKTYHVWGRHPFLYKLVCIITFLGQENKLRKLTVEKLELKKGDTVLDLACGTGLNLKFLEDAVGPNGKIIAFDYSNEMLMAAKQRAKEHSWNNIIFIQGDAAQLSLDTKVDGVLSTLGISAIPEWEKALKRCKELLRSGGKIIVCDARLFTGILKILNPLIKLIYSKFAAWDPSKNITEKMKEIFGNIEVENFNFGTFFITASIKKG